jgi:cytochrome P450
MTMATPEVETTEGGAAHAGGVRATDYNPFSAEVRHDPYPYYEVLRRERPVAQAMGLPIYTVTRYDDVLNILQNPEIFSSTALTLLTQGGVGMMPNDGALAGHRIFSSSLMIATDPPDHGPLRKLVNRGFTPRRIAALEPRLCALADELLDPIVGRGEMDLVPEFSVPFPVMVISELLGVEPEMRDQFKAWSSAIVLGIADVTGTYTKQGIRQAADEICDYIESVVAARRAKPRDDLISVLVQAEGGEALTVDEVITFTLLLLIAGNETTTNLIGSAMVQLTRHPDQLAEVAADFSLVPGMLEEAVRHQSPIQGIPRKVMQEVEVAGTSVPKDAMLMIMFGSANRDEKHFPDPDRFDIHRNTQGHLGFGHGIHFCLGAALARLEGKIAYEALLSKCGNIQLATDEIPMVDSLLLRGPKSVPISFTHR